MYANKNDVAEFADLTIQLMDDPDMRRAMGKIARERIDGGLTWDHQAASLIALYDDLFGLPSRVSSDCPERNRNVAKGEAGKEQVPGVFVR